MFYEVKVIIVSKQHAIKAYGVVDGKLHVFIISAQGTGEWTAWISASYTLKTKCSVDCRASLDTVMMKRIMFFVASNSCIPGRSTALW